MKLAIIGSAGRRSDAKLMKGFLMDWMEMKVMEYVASRGCVPGDVILVSGGSAFADHVAVCLFKKHPFRGLELCLPTAFHAGPCTCRHAKRHKPHYADNGDAYDNPGRSLNLYHQAFAFAVGGDPLSDIKSVYNDKQLTLKICHGFHSRNTSIAMSCTSLLAFTFRIGTEPPTTGGTRDTWDKCDATKHKVHYSLVHVQVSDVKVIEFVCNLGWL